MSDVESEYEDYRDAKDLEDGGNPNSSSRGLLITVGLVLVLLLLAVALLAVALLALLP